MKSIPAAVKIPLFFVVFATIACQNIRNDSDTSGLPKKYTQFVQDSYQLFPNNDKLKNVKDLQPYIKKFNPNRNEKNILTSALAYLIDRAATCLDIDKRVYMSLVRKESTFIEDAESPTGAVGLTQMTSIGIQEVNDQLGERGTDQAYANTIEYFNTAIKNSAIAENSF